MAIRSNSLRPAVSRDATGSRGVGPSLSVSFFLSVRLPADRESRRVHGTQGRVPGRKWWERSQCAQRSHMDFFARLPCPKRRAVEVRWDQRGGWMSRAPSMLLSHASDERIARELLTRIRCVSPRPVALSGFRKIEGLEKLTQLRCLSVAAAHCACVSGKGACSRHLHYGAHIQRCCDFLALSAAAICRRIRSRRSRTSIR